MASPKDRPLRGVFSNHTLHANSERACLEIHNPNRPPLFLPREPRELVAWGMEHLLSERDLGAAVHLLDGLRRETPTAALSAAGLDPRQEVRPPADGSTSGPVVHLGSRYVLQQLDDGKGMMVHDLMTLGFGYDARAVALLADAAGDKAPLTMTYKNGRGTVQGQRPAVTAWLGTVEALAAVETCLDQERPLLAAEHMMAASGPHSRRDQGLIERLDTLRGGLEATADLLDKIADPARYKEAVGHAPDARTEGVPTDPARLWFRSADAYVTNLSYPKPEPGQPDEHQRRKTTLRTAEQAYIALQQRALGRRQEHAQTQGLGG